MTERSVEEVLNKALPSLEQDRVALLQELDELTRADLTRLSEKRKRMDDNDPRAAKLERRVAGTEHVAKFTRQALELHGRKPQNTAWVVEGTVLDAARRPAGRAKIEFVGEDGAGFKGIGAAETSGNGTFRVEVAAEVLAEIARGKRAIFLKVTTRDGDVRSGLGPIPPVPGDYSFDLVIRRAKGKP